MQYIIVSFIVLGIFVVTTMMLCGMANSTDHERDDAEQLKWIHQLSEEKKRSEWNHKKQLENEVTKRNR